jgi:uncharacterized protein involved in copper resistance
MFIVLRLPSATAAFGAIAIGSDHDGERGEKTKSAVGIQGLLPYRF